MTMLRCLINKPTAILAQVMLGLCFVGLSTSVHALGLGNLRVKSALDEPLLAEIELTSSQASALESLEVKLGSVEDFKRAGVTRAEYLQGLEFELSNREGTPIIRITTQQPAREPFLHFLVAAKWAGGRLLREYTALLDPPKYTAEAPATIRAPRESVDSGVRGAMQPAAVPEPEMAPAVSAPAGAQPTAATPPAASASTAGRNAQYGPTEEGDTLWNIASSLDTGDPDVDVYQVMLALLRENPDAFINNNINRMKKGQVLRLDNIDAIGEIGKQEAVAAYQAQLEEWQSYKSTLAQQSGEVSVPSEPAGAEKVAEAAAAAPAMQPGKPEIPTAAESQDVLKIVRATVDKEREDQATAGADQAAANEELQRAEREVATLREQMLTLEESLASRELENRELQERVAMLEEQVSNARRLMEIESRELALAQQQARENAEAAEKAAAAADAASKPEQPTAAAETAAPAEAPVAAAAKPAPPKQVAETQPKPAAKPKPAPKPAAAKPAPKPAGAATRRVASPPPEPEKSWWENIMDTVFGSWMWMVAAVVGLIVLVVGGLLFLRRRRSIAEFEESILSGSALEGQTETTDTGVSSDGTDTSFLSDFGMAGMGSMQADEVDPLAEAEVYLAYGRDEQAEEVLKEAVGRNPDRAELKLKLLEIYQHRNDLKSFETIAEELYPASGQVDAAVWQQVIKMGRKMNPDNPLFTQEMPAVATADATADVAADVTELDFSKPDAGTPAERGEDDVDLSAELSEELMKSSSAPVDPGLQPFPLPETDTDLEEQLDKLTGEVDVGAGQTADTGTEATAFKSVGDDETLNFATDNVAELDFNLDLDEPVSGEDADKSAAGDTDTEFELGDLDFEFTDVEDKSANEPTTVEKSQDDGEATLEFEAEDIPPQETWGPASNDKAPGAGADDRPALDLVDTGSGGDEAGPQGDAEQWDEAATKLDLAKAYLDMGDKAGARSIIEEVMKEGNAAQRDQAAQLATQLG